MVVAALVVVIVNALLTWWVVFVLRENRARLDLQRERAVHAGHHERDRIEMVMAELQASALQALLVRPGAELGAPPDGLDTWALEAGQCEPGWTLDDGRAVLRLASGDGCVRAELAEAWRSGLFELPENLELVEATGDEVEVRLAVPYADRAIRPTQATLDEILNLYKSRIKMMISEGTFFALLLFGIIALLWKTLRREVELELQHRNFLSAITHELKSPLAAMRLSLETVLRGRADGTASVRFLENALQDTERLQSLVQKVLEVTRYGRESGTLKVRRNCLSDVIEDALHTFRGRATSAGARIETEIAADIWVEIDEEAFGIAVSNLLENAIKYGGTLPKVEIKARVEDGVAVVDVIDNGKGIAEEEVPFIFNRFFRGGDEMTRTSQGTGLGLYLVRQIVTAHKGSVSVHSTGPEGTTFRVEIPGAEVWESAV